MSTRRTLPPGPKGNLLAGSFPLAARDPLALYTEWSREFGDIFYYRSGFRRIYFLNHPDLVEQLLVTQAQKFKKDWVLRNARWLFGKPLPRRENSRFPSAHGRIVPRSAPYRDSWRAPSGNGVWRLPIALPLARGHRG